MKFGKVRQTVIKNVCVEKKIDKNRITTPLLKYFIELIFYLKFFLGALLSDAVLKGFICKQFLIQLNEITKCNND